MIRKVAAATMALIVLGSFTPPMDWWDICKHAVAPRVLPPGHPNVHRLDRFFP